MCNWLFPEKISTAEPGRTAARQSLVAALVAGLAAGMFATVPARAQAAQSGSAPAHENTFEVTPFIGYMGGGKFEDPTDSSDRDVEQDTNWGVFLNLNVESPERQYEMFYSRLGTTVEGEVPIDMDIQYLQIGGIVNFTDVERAIPYFGMTVGATQFSPDGDGLDNETKLSFTVGGGVKVPITEHIGVRLDARAFVTVLDTDGNFFCVSGEAGAACRITASSDTFVQYAVGLGVVAAF